MNKTIASHIYDGLEIESVRADRITVLANSWLAFIRFLGLRNRGYGIRKILNLLTELIELGTLAYIMDISLLQSFILLPITHMIVGYLQEYHTVLYRATFNKKSNLIFIFGVFLAITSMIYFLIDQRQTVNTAVFIIFGLRCAVIIAQTVFTCQNIVLLATKRVRPNFRFQWGSLLIATILAVASLQFPINGFYHIILIGVIFNTIRFLQELIYYKIVKNEIHKLRFAKNLYERPECSLKSAWHESALIFFHLFTIACFSFKFDYFTFFKWPILVFFIISFYDRILSRPFRSMNLEITRLLEKKYFSYTHRLSRRLLAVTTGFVIALIGLILMVKRWPVSHMLPTISILAVGVVSNALLSSRKVSLWSTQRKIEIFIGLQFVLVLLLIDRNLPNFVLYSACLVITLFGVYLVTHEETVFEYNHRVQNNGLNLLPKNLQSFEVHWNSYANNWREASAKIEKFPLYFLNFNRRTKYIFAKNENQLDQWLNQYPLNIHRVKKVIALPAAPALTKPETAELVYLSYFGFWKGFKKTFKFQKAELEEMHNFNRRWINRNIYGGGTKETSTDYHIINMAHKNGNYLWLRRK